MTMKMSKVVVSWQNNDDGEAWDGEFSATDRNEVDDEKSFGELFMKNEMQNGCLT